MRLPSPPSRSSMKQVNAMKAVLAALLAAACSLSLAAQNNVCTTVLDGSGCGPQLDVTFTPVGTAGNNKITIAGSGMHMDGVGVMAWGTQPISVPIWGSCFAYTDFIWGHPINIDASGSWSWSRSWPNSVQATYRIQLASVGLDAGGNVSILTTDCIVASCTL